jgi:hypothetical protein
MRAFKLLIVLIVLVIIGRLVMPESEKQRMADKEKIRSMPTEQREAKEKTDFIKAQSKRSTEEQIAVVEKIEAEKAARQKAKEDERIKRAEKAMAENYKKNCTIAIGLANDNVRKKLKSPGSAVFPTERETLCLNFGDNRFEIAGYVDSQNSFGALLRTNYSAIVKRSGDLVFEIESLKLEKN